MTDQADEAEGTGTAGARRSRSGGKRASSPAIEVEAGERVIRISNPDRVYFPQVGLTKRDLVDYYLSVSDGIVRGQQAEIAQMQALLQKRGG